jgi:ribonuclease T2
MKLLHPVQMTENSGDASTRSISKQALGASLFLLFLIGSACAQQGVAPRIPRPASTEVSKPADKSFDYYVLALSWSPEHCASPAGQRSSLQCEGPRRYGFIVHGLWPQFEKGYPADCADTPMRLSSARRKDILEIMPSEGLMRHEWRKHGTCSGLEAEHYFERVEQAWAEVRIPPAFKNAGPQVEYSGAAIEQAFTNANPGMTPQMLGLTCSGTYLQEVRVCFNQNLKLRACSAEVDRSCRVAKIKVRPM